MAQSLHVAQRWHKVHTVWRHTQRQPTFDNTSQSGVETASIVSDSLHHYESILNRENGEYLAQQGLYDERLRKDLPSMPLRRSFGLKVPSLLRGSDFSGRGPTTVQTDTSFVARRLLDKRKTLKKDFSIDFTPLLITPSKQGGTEDAEKTTKVGDTEMITAKALEDEEQNNMVNSELSEINGALSNSNFYTVSDNVLNTRNEVLQSATWTSIESGVESMTDKGGDTHDHLSAPISVPRNIKQMNKIDSLDSGCESLCYKTQEVLFRSVWKMSR